MGKICVLRLGHRRERDQRITTHVFLAARALGASEGVLCGDADVSVLEGIEKVVGVWGGTFEIKYEEDWKKFLRSRKEAGWKVVHLTMYGENFEERAMKISNENVVVVIGAGKVPVEAYELADWNLSVTTQPHSEVAAVSLFLDRYFSGKELLLDFKGKLWVAPCASGKVVIGARRTKK